MEEVPFWVSDLEEYLEFLHGDADSLREQHGDFKTAKKSYKHEIADPKKCPSCNTVFHQTRRGGSEPCPFCRSMLNFIIM